MDFLSVEDILSLHADQVELYGGSHDVRDMGLLCSPPLVQLLCESARLARRGLRLEAEAWTGGAGAVSALRQVLRKGQGR
jgi:hypothetical protein